MEQGAAFDSILFNILHNVVFMWLSIANLDNVADNTSISSFSKDLKDAIKNVENASECARKRFKNTCMGLNRCKFLFVIIKKTNGKINLQN